MTATSLDVGEPSVNGASTVPFITTDASAEPLGSDEPPNVYRSVEPNTSVEPHPSVEPRPSVEPSSTVALPPDVELESPDPAPATDVVNQHRYLCPRTGMMRSKRFFVNSFNSIRSVLTHDRPGRAAGQSAYSLHGPSPFTPFRGDVPDRITIGDTVAFLLHSGNHVALALAEIYDLEKQYRIHLQSMSLIDDLTPSSILKVRICDLREEPDGWAWSNAFALTGVKQVQLSVPASIVVRVKVSTAYQRGNDPSVWIFDASVLKQVFVERAALVDVHRLLIPQLKQKAKEPEVFPYVDCEGKAFSSFKIFSFNNWTTTRELRFSGGIK